MKSKFQHTVIRITAAIGQIRKKLRDQHLSLQILCVVIAAIITLAAGSFVMLHYVSNTYNEIISEKNAQSLVTYAEQIDNRLEELNITTLSKPGRLPHRGSDEPGMDGDPPQHFNAAEKLSHQ